MAKYTVYGHCLVPAKVRIEVESDSKQEAMAAARESNWRESIHPQSHEDSAACDFEPTIADKQ